MPSIGRGKARKTTEETLPEASRFLLDPCCVLPFGFDHGESVEGIDNRGFSFPGTAVEPSQAFFTGGRRERGRSGG